MTSEWRSLVEGFDSADTADREEAILQLALLLERNSVATFSDEDDLLHKNELPAALIKQRLDDAAYAEVVDWLFSRVSASKQRTGMLWAISKATRSSAFSRLEALLAQGVSDWDGEDAYQLLIALDSHWGDKARMSLDAAAELQRLQANSDDRTRRIATRLASRASRR